MKVTCRSCGADILSEDISLNNTLAKCRQCEEVFDFSYQLSGAEQDEARRLRDAPRPHPETTPGVRRPRSEVGYAAGEHAGIGSPGPRPLVPMPKAISIQKRGSRSSSTQLGGQATPYRVAPTETPAELTITRRWFSARCVQLAIFALFWDGFLVVWYNAALGAKSTPLFALIFPLLHVGVGMGLTYTALAGLLNHTVIRVTHDDLHIVHRPLPWWGTDHLASRDLRQLYCERVEGGGMRGMRLRWNRSGPSEPTYSVNAVLRSGRKLELLTGLDAFDQALFIEREIEEWLGIADESVADEHRPGTEEKPGTRIIG